MRDEGAIALAPSLFLLKKLSVLNLASNKIGSSGMTALVGEKALPSLNKLTVLQLSGNHIGDNGMIVLAQILPLMTKLQYLDLSNNKIQIEGGKKIAIALPAMTELRGLNITSNNLGDEGIKAIMEAVETETEIGIDTTRGITRPSVLPSHAPRPTINMLNANNITSDIDNRLIQFLRNIIGLVYVL